jgi:two-component system sensor histidine kinase TctE
MSTESNFGSASLRRQLLLWLLIPFFLLWLLNAVVAYRLALQTADSAYDKSLHDVTLALSNQIKLNHGQIEVQLPQSALDILQADEKDSIYYLINDQSGNFVFGHRGLPPPPGKASNALSHARYYDTEFKGEQVRAVAIAVPVSGERGEYVVIQAAETLVKRRELVQEWLLSMVLPQLLLLFLASVTIWYGVGRGLRPVAKLRDEINARSQYDLSPFSDTQAAHELKPLIRGINELMARLDHLMAVQQRFIADAAHQLRTPLAGLKAQAELALRLEDPVEIRHSLQQMYQAASQSAHLAQQLLALARAEPSGKSSVDVAELDWVAMVRQVAMDWAQEALRKNIDFGFETSSKSLLMAGDGLLLSQMMNNLIDNALRYTPSNGHVTVRIAEQDDSLVIAVEDDGIGIPEEQREVVFERFYRVLGTEQSGCGLGLAIVIEIAQRHGGSVSIKDGAHGVGSVFVLCFPKKKREANE